MYRKHKLSGAGYQPFEHDSTVVRMHFKMIFFFVVLVIVLHIACMAGLFSFKLDPLERQVIAKYYLAVGMCDFHDYACRISIPFVYQGHRYPIPAGDFILYVLDSFPDVLSNAYFKIINLFWWSLLIYLILPAILFYYFRRSKAEKEKLHVEGAELITAKKMKARLKKKPTHISFGQVRMPTAAETAHAFIIGSSGSGKTNTLNQVVDEVIRRGDPAIIYDSKGDFIRRFYRPGIDHIFNPVLADSLKWNIFNDIRRERDIDAIAAYLIPDNKYASQPFFEKAARDVFAGILHYLLASDRRSNKDIFQVLRMDREALATALKSCDEAHDGYDPISIPASNQAAGVISTLKQHTSFFKYMAEAKGDFSVDAWCEQPQGNIFVLNTPDMEATLKPIFSLFVNMFARRLLTMPDSEDRRIFFFLDEFGSLQKLEAILGLLTRSRSKGGSCWLGVQDLGIIEEVYGRSHKETIVNACGTKFLMRVTDAATQKYLSEIIGESTFIVPEETRSLGIKDHKDGLSISHRERTKPLVMASEFGKLADGEGYITFPGVGAFAKVRPPYKKFPVQDLALKEKDAVKEKRLLRPEAKAPDSAQQTGEGISLKKVNRDKGLGLFTDLMNEEV